MSDQRAAESSLLQALRDAQGGDERALGILLEHLLPIARSWCMGRLDDPGLRDLADDIVQETGIRIARHIDQCTASSVRQLVAWVLTITHREALRMLDRDWLRHGVVLEGADRDPVTQDSAAETTSASREIGTLLADAYRGLPELGQRLIYDRLMDGLSWGEIGDGLGTTAGAAKRRYQRMLVRLRNEVISAAQKRGTAAIALPNWLEEVVE